MPTKFSESLQSLTEATARLAEALALPKDSIVRDSAVKRFEMAFDLAWKTTKAWLEEQGVMCASPKSCLQEGFRQGLLEYEEIWLETIELRNASVHSYDEEVAEKVYARLPVVLEALQKLLKKF